MPINKCASQVAANIALDCANPIFAGYEDTAILINKQDIDDYVRDATNPRMISDITLKTGAKTVAIYNPTTDPYDGTQDEANLDGLMPAYNKTVSFAVPKRGSDTAKDIIEPLMKNREGFVVVLATKDKVGDGSFVIVGSETGLVGTTQTRNNIDKSTGGAWIVTLVEEGAQFAEVNLFMTNYQTSRAAFDALMLKSYPA